MVAFRRCAGYAALNRVIGRPGITTVAWRKTCESSVGHDGAWREVWIERRDQSKMMSGRELCSARP